jgi:hypothetical protein
LTGCQDCRHLVIGVQFNVEQKVFPFDCKSELSAHVHWKRPGAVQVADLDVGIIGSDPPVILGVERDANVSRSGDRWTMRDCDLGVIFSERGRLVVGTSGRSDQKKYYDKPLRSSKSH